MSEHTSRLLSLTEPAFAPLRRQGLASFLVLLSDGHVIAATPPCQALGVLEGQGAPAGVSLIARDVAAHSAPGPRLERVRLPAGFVPRTFSCVTLSTPLGPAVLFADPGALSDISPLPVPEALPEAAAARPVRFTWEADAEGRLLSLSSTFLEALGPRLSRWQGRSFSDLSEAGLLKETARLAELIQGGATFSDAVLWTGEDPPRRIEIGGVPLFDGTRRRIGVRGFGLIWQAPPAPPLQIPHHVVPQNVVPLRGGALSAHERSAFHEIARSLNEAIDGWGKTPRLVPAARDTAAGSTEPDVSARPSPAGEPAPLPAEKADVPSSLPPTPEAPSLFDTVLLDRLPVGIAVQQRGEIVHVNETLLTWSGVADRVAFLAAGGLNAFLIRSADQMALRALDGTLHPVEVRLVSAPWQGGTAILHTIRLLDRPAPVAEPVFAAPAEAELAAARALGQLDALNAIPYPVFLVDLRGAIQHLNAAAADLCGFSEGEVRGEPFTLAFAHESQREVVALLDAAAAAAGAAQCATGLRARHRLGAEREMRVAIHAAPPRADVFCVLLQEAAPLPEEQPPLFREPSGPTPEADAALDPFVRRVSHAVRVPLTPIVGFVDAVRSAAFGPIGNRRYAKHAEAAAIAAERLLASLEDIEAMAEPRPVAEPAEPVSVSREIRSALDHLAASAKRRRVLMRWDEGAAAEARIDATILAQCLRLVLEEAIGATPEGGQVVVSVSPLEQSGREQSVTIRVRDGGRGLSEGEIALALSPLHPARTSDRFASSGRPFRMARVAALLIANGGALDLRRGVDVGMLCELHLPG